MYPLMQAIWGDIWKHTLEKSPTNATNEITQPSWTPFQAGNLRRPKVTKHPLKLNCGSAKIGLMHKYIYLKLTSACLCHHVHPQSKYKTRFVVCIFGNLTFQNCSADVRMANITFFTTYVPKHRKNCECCPVLWFQVINCQNCNKCLKCHTSI